MVASSRAEIQRPLSAAEFRDVIGYFASGVTIITAQSPGQPHGTTASAVCSLSLEPPMVLICMNKSSATGHAVSETQSFAVNILGEEQGELATRFATKDPEKFRGVPTVQGTCGQPLLTDAVAHLECEVQEEVSVSTHIVFLANVVSATGHGGAPLAYFRGQFGRLDLEDYAAAHKALRQWVLDHEEAWGRSLDVLRVAEEMGLGPGASFHALSKLTGDGLLYHRPDGSYVIAPVTFEIVKSTLDARLAVEFGAAEIAVRNPDPEGLAKLAEAMRATFPLISGSRFTDGAAYTAANNVFHERLVALARSPVLLDSYRQLDAAGMITALQGGIPEESAVEGLAEDHRRIVEALQAGDGAAARAAVAEHGARALETARRAMEMRAQQRTADQEARA